MARNADPHPEPNDPNEGPTPKFPPGTAPVNWIALSPSAGAYASM